MDQISDQNFFRSVSINKTICPQTVDLQTIMTDGIPKKKIKNNAGQEEIMNFQIWINAVCGDNKGIYELLGNYLGFHTSFSSQTFICRICKASDKELGKCKEPDRL